MYCALCIKNTACVQVGYVETENRTLPIRHVEICSCIELKRVVFNKENTGCLCFGHFFLKRLSAIE